MCDIDIVPDIFVIRVYVNTKLSYVGHYSFM